MGFWGLTGSGSGSRGLGFRGLGLGPRVEHSWIEGRGKQGRAELQMLFNTTACSWRTTVVFIPELHQL